MKEDSTSPISYNLSQALFGLSEEQVRRDQCGAVRRKGKAWYIRFNEWQADEARNHAPKLDPEYLLDVSTRHSHSQNDEEGRCNRLN